MWPAGWSETRTPLKSIVCAVVDRLDGRVGAEPRAEDALALERAQVATRAPARVVAVRVRDDRAVDRLPRIDVEVSGLAVESVRVNAEQRHGD